MPRPRKNITQAEAPVAIRDRREFRASKLSARYVTSYNTGYGDLPAGWRERFRVAYRNSRFERRLYVVCSFETPIAWALGDDVTFPDVRYSITTTKHQWIAAEGFGLVDQRPWDWPRAVPVGRYAGQSWQAREWGA
jgi:hypothetical protein